MPMIQSENIQFDYGSKRILHDISFNIPEGSITALVGPNGSGKTTLLRCLTGLEQPLSGTIKVNGFDVSEQPHQVHKMTGYLSDFFGLYNALTIRQCLSYMAACHQIPEDRMAARIDEVAALTSLTDRMEQKAGTLSRGYRQRLGIAIAIIHDPALIILDEPASGMDPEARIALSQTMREWKKQKKTILVSSHILNELEDYCTDMLVLREGRIVDHVFLKQDENAGGVTLEISVLDVSDADLAFVSSQDMVSLARIEDGKIICVFKGTAEDRQQLLSKMIANNIKVTGFTVAETSLADAYMNLSKTGK